MAPGDGRRIAESHRGPVFTDGDLYKAGRNGQCLYVSPRHDVVVVWFSTRYGNDAWLASHARAIVKHLAADS